MLSITGYSIQQFKYKLYTTDGIIESNDWNDISKKDGSIQYEEWRWCGILHRHDYTKPASIYAKGSCSYYWWYGVKCKPKQLLDKDFRDRIQLERLG